MSNFKQRTPEQSLREEIKDLIDKRNMLTERTKNRVINELQKEKLEKEERRKALQREVLKEIITSEERYINQLETIIKFFRSPLEESLQNTRAAELFNSIQTLCGLNKELLSNLKSDTRVSSVAEDFDKMAPFFKIYSTYTTEYKRVIFTIQELRRHDQRLDDALMRQETRPEVGIRLNSLLIVPIQRVPRYRLLLKELQHYSLPNRTEYIKITDALQKMEGVTEHINSQVACQENIIRLMQIQETLSNGKPSIIMPGRNLIKEGILMKASKNGDKGKPRHFVLMTDSLMCCKVKLGTYHCSCMLPLRKCTIEPVLGRGVFSISSPNNNLLLYSEDAKIADEWVEAITSAKAQYEDRIKTLQKKIASRPALQSRLSLGNKSAPNTTEIRKRKLDDENASCFNGIKKKMVLVSKSSSLKGNEIKERGNKENEEGYITGFRRLLTALQNYWF